HGAERRDRCGVGGHRALGGVCQGRYPLAPSPLAGEGGGGGMTRIRDSTKRARALRSASTDAERALWRGLRGEQLVFKFRRQYVVHQFIVDFICLERRLIVEVDGAQHAEQQAQYDAARDRFLKREGF